MDSRTPGQVVVVTVGERHLALSLSLVARAVPAVAVTPLPGSRAPVLGTIDVHGAVIPVVDLRDYLGEGTRPVGLSDRMVIVETSRSMVALLVDSVNGVRVATDRAVPSEATRVEDSDMFLADALASLAEATGEPS